MPLTNPTENQYKCQIQKNIYNDKELRKPISPITDLPHPVIFQ